MGLPHQYWYCSVESVVVLMSRRPTVVAHFGQVLSCSTGHVQCKFMIDKEGTTGQCCEQESLQTNAF